jgi:BolA-like protein 1
MGLSIKPSLFRKLFSKVMEAPGGSLRESIREKLNRVLKPVHLDIVDDSSSHAEHEAMKQNFGFLETHFKIYIVSEAFLAKSPVQRHRMVYELIDEELKTKGLHAVNIVTKTPQEYESQLNKVSSK